MKLKGFTPLEVKKEQFLFMKRLTYIIHPLHHGHVTHFFEDQQPRNRLKSVMGSIAITDQHKILFPVVPNMIGFARETNSPFTSWSRDPFFEG